MAPPGARGLYAAFPLLDGRQTRACLSSMLRAWHFSLCTSIIKPMFPGLLQEAGGSLPGGLSASVLDREVSAQRTLCVHRRKALSIQECPTGAKLIHGSVSPEKDMLPLNCTF